MSRHLFRRDKRVSPALGHQFADSRGLGLEAEKGGFYGIILVKQTEDAVQGPLMTSDCRTFECGEKQG